MTIAGNFESFQYFNFEANFLKNANPFNRLGYCFLVESTKIKNTTFLFKTALSEANVKTNRMGSTKWTYHKEQNFDSNYFIFSNVCFSLRTSHKELSWCTNHPNVHIQTFWKHWNFIWDWFFPLSILKKRLQEGENLVDKQFVKDSRTLSYYRTFSTSTLAFVLQGPGLVRR